PPGARLTWSAAECILSGARHASSNDAILDAIAADYKVVAARPDRAGSITNTAALSSVEGYVLSCIQSPLTILEACSITGLSHVETNRAIFALILLGLLVEVRSSADNPAVADGEVQAGAPATTPPNPADRMDLDGRQVRAEAADQYASSAPVSGSPVAQQKN